MHRWQQVKTYDFLAQFMLTQIRKNTHKYACTQNKIGETISPFLIVLGTSSPAQNLEVFISNNFYV